MLDLLGQGKNESSSGKIPYLLKAQLAFWGKNVE
jgi:hypothetical protein